MYPLKRFYHVAFPAVSCLLVIIALLFLKISACWFEMDWAAITTLIVGISAFYIGWVQLKSSNDTLEKDLFFEFNRRYDEFNDNLNLIHEAKEVGVIQLFKKPGQQFEETVEETVKKIVIDYFNLCSEQYYWYQKGRIEECVWNFWFAGMTYHFVKDNNEIVNKLADREFNGANLKESYYGFSEYLRQKRIIT